MSGTLPSGLPVVVGDDEDLARFLYSKGDFAKTKGVVKPAAFQPRNRELSVSRHGPTPRESLWSLAPQREGPSLKGAAILKARAVRQSGLDIHADDEPPRHANIIGWPPEDADPEAGQARWMDFAGRLASVSTLILHDSTK